VISSHRHNSDGQLHVMPDSQLQKLGKSAAEHVRFALCSDLLTTG
jgi:hypothetical protein